MHSPSFMSETTPAASTAKYLTSGEVMNGQQLFSSHLESPGVESARLPLTERRQLNPLKRKDSPMKWLTLAVVPCLTLYLALSSITASAGQRRSVARVRYSGSRHTTGHGGHYAGGRGSSHKGGHYRNARSGNHYGRHK